MQKHRDRWRNLNASFNWAGERNCQRESCPLKGKANIQQFADSCNLRALHDISSQVMFPALCAKTQEKWALITWCQPGRNCCYVASNCNSGSKPISIDCRSLCLFNSTSMQTLAWLLAIIFLFSTTAKAQADRGKQALGYGRLDAEPGRQR
jgi:hypothetical protein